MARKMTMRLCVGLTMSIHLTGQSLSDVPLHQIEAIAYDFLLTMQLSPVFLSREVKRYEVVKENLMIILPM